MSNAVRYLLCTSWQTFNMKYIIEIRDTYKQLSSISYQKCAERTQKLDVRIIACFILYNDFFVCVYFWGKSLFVAKKWEGSHNLWKMTGLYFSNENWFISDSDGEVIIFQGKSLYDSWKTTGGVIKFMVNYDWRGTLFKGRIFQYFCHIDPSM